MSLSLLFLLLASATAVADDHRTHSYPGGADPNVPYPIIHSGGFNKHITYTDAGQTSYRRQKRGVSAFFRAWKRLLRTTIGFQTVYANIGGGFIQGKKYLKVGSLDDAIQDFHSLGPTNIEHRTYGLSGEVGKKFILLRSNPTQIGVYDMNSP